MDSRVIVLCATLLVCIVRVNGYVSGAPDIKEICETMKPGHGDTKPQNTSSPYGIQLSTMVPKVGETVTVTILSTPQGPSFKGYLVQARKADSNDKTPSGSFIPGGDQKGLTCGAQENSTLTHTNNKARKTASALWKPSEPGKYVIHYTVVQDGETYWVDEKSLVITVS